MTSGRVRGVSYRYSMKRNGTPPKWSPCRWVISTASSFARSHGTSFAACRMLGPQSSRNVAPSTSVRYALWKRPPAPNASPEPSTVTRMTRCDTESAPGARPPGRGARRTAWPLEPWRAPPAIEPIFTRAGVHWPEVSSSIRSWLGPLPRGALATLRRSPTLLRLRRQALEAPLELVELVLHASGADGHVLEGPGERVALLLQVTHIALEVRQDVGAFDHEIKRAELHEPDRGGCAHEKSQQQREQEPDDRHASSSTRRLQRPRQGFVQRPAA